MKKRLTIALCMTIVGALMFVARAKPPAEAGGDLFDVLYPEGETIHPSIHAFSFAMMDHATGGVTLAQLKAYLVNNFNMNSTGEAQITAVSADILGAANPLDRATEYCAVLHMRADGLLYTTNTELKTRLGF